MQGGLKGKAFRRRESLAIQETALFKRLVEAIKDDDSDAILKVRYDLKQTQKAILAPS
ncbi:MAG: hypothetical protein WC639_04955 [Patescibacteria group bacterium]|jgi:hypothetical protein